MSFCLGMYDLLPLKSCYAHDTCCLARTTLFDVVLRDCAQIQNHVIHAHIYASTP